MRLNTCLKMKKKKKKEKKRKENPDEIVNHVEKTLDFHNQKQEWQGLKILTPEHMLCRLPITLAK